MRQPLYGEHNCTHELNIQVRSHERTPVHASASLWRSQLHPCTVRMRQPLYGKHNYTHELNIQVRSHERITAHESASLWRAQLHTHEQNIQVRVT